ncbi:MAG TPA: flagellar basal body P-ring formation chaperone FlgA [Legionella sp.]|nr:flagellar basal body P-ring formation chaperone FlgA [Legionella sp.]
MKFAINYFWFVTLAFTVNAQPTLRFQPRITSDALILNDLLIITDDKAAIGGLALDTKLKPNQRITKEQIIEWLKQKKAAVSFNWRGKKSALIKAKYLSSGKDLVNKAQSALYHRLQQQEYERIEITNKSIPKGSELPLTAFKVLVSGKYPVAKQICVSLYNDTDSIAIWFEVKAYKKVMIARHNIKSNSPVKASDFVLQIRNIAGLQDVPKSQLSEPSWLKLGIKENQILSSRYLIPYPDVISGESVHIKLIKNKVLIATQGIVQNHAWVGEKVRVKNPLTNKYFSGTVTAKQEVEIYQ